MIYFNTRFKTRSQLKNWEKKVERYKDAITVQGKKENGRRLRYYVSCAKKLFCIERKIGVLSGLRNYSNLRIK